jgi:pantetheine-phosphate adenylyltransferase
MKTAILPGTFDPFTTGHASLVERGLELFDKVVIAIGINSEKKSLFSLEERILHISECYKNNSRVEVCSYGELTATYAKTRGINFILRGMRTLADFEYERLLADVNKKISGIETICLFTEPELSFVQSNVVRDLIKNNQDISAFVPKPVLELIKRKK